MDAYEWSTLLSISRLQAQLVQSLDARILNVQVMYITTPLKCGRGQGELRTVWSQKAACQQENVSLRDWSKLLIILIHDNLLQIHYPFKDPFQPIVVALYGRSLS
jgi:hypothetical protein